MENPPDNFTEQFKKSKELLLSTLNELRSVENLYREILIRDLYEKLDNNSLLIEANISWGNTEHFLNESAKMIYTKGMNPEIDLLHSLVDSDLERIKFLWEEVKEKYPLPKTIYTTPEPPEDFSRN